VPPNFQALANTKEYQMKQDRVVVITGAAGGMGSVLVERFLANGDTVIATDTKDEGLEALRAKVGANTKLLAHKADISKEEDCARLAVVARDKAGRIDVLINCAGFPDCVLRKNDDRAVAADDRHQPDRQFPDDPRNASFDEGARLGPHH
jgi:NAD(P)-dependent dehydrogenase (short-subunit alcohol dehydrogenase family)